MLDEFETLYALCSNTKDPNIHLKFGAHYVRYLGHSTLCVSRKPGSLNDIENATKTLLGIIDDPQSPECLIEHPDPRVTANATLLVLHKLVRGKKKPNLSAKPGDAELDNSLYRSTRSRKR